MRLISRLGFSKSSVHSYIPEGVIIAETLLKIFKYNRLDQALNNSSSKNPVLLIDSLLDQLDLKFDIPEEDLKNIPGEGAFIIVANHPFRGIDSMILFKLIHKIRPDFRILASNLLQKIEPLKDIIIPVNTFESHGKKSSSIQGIKEAINHLKEGHCIGIFPTGEDTSTMEVSKIIVDIEWQRPALKFIKNANVPVIPAYFHGTNSRLQFIAGKIHPILRIRKLPKELASKERTIKVRIGSQIPVKDQNEFKEITYFGRYLRARTYSLGSALEPAKFFPKRLRLRARKAEPIADPIPSHILVEEFNSVRKEYELFSTKNYSVICAPTLKIPLIFNEIGRLRELTFRKVGEGTNKSIDIDQYDFYFNHLFIWDTAKNSIVGAYRIGKGKEIVSIYGINGFYISSLFQIRTSFSPVLSRSLELGRSFITEEYQRKPLSLFLLWKGIMVFLLKHPEYRYLIGPVSISNDFSRFSKSLIVSFIRKYFSDEELAAYIEPRKAFIVKPDRVIDSGIFIDNAESDINKIEKIIMDIEPGYRLPVLLKKYLEINGRIIAFNIDPAFNYCLDGLLILDLYKTPPDFIKGLSKEMNDPSILERFIKQ
jgi:putative hemolysin